MGTWVFKMPLNLIGMCFRVDTACPGGPESNMNMEHLSWGRHLRVPPRQSLLRRERQTFLRAGVGFPLQPFMLFSQRRGEPVQYSIIIFLRPPHFIFTKKQSHGQHSDTRCPSADSTFCAGSAARSTVSLFIGFSRIP